MQFGELLRQKKEAIVNRWFEDALALYPGVGGDAFRSQQDQFANPVGHSLRVGTREIFDALVESMDDAAITDYLTEIIKIRAVQQCSPSAALRFIFGLKDAVRAETADANDVFNLAQARREFDAQIDRVALQAFDIFVACREQVYQMRVNEAKRRVSWVIDRLNGEEAAAEQPDADASHFGPELVQLAHGQREGSR